MYRYLLFHYYDYYPSGGMRDCSLKTNNFDDLIPFINEHYNDTLFDKIYYYDTFKDEYKRAKMEEYRYDHSFFRQRFLEWE